MFRLAASIVGPSDADDIVQDAFVDAWTHLRSLRDVGSIDPWLRRIVVNRCRMRLRSLARRPIRELSIDDVGTRGLASHDRGDFSDAVHARLELERVYVSLDDDSRVMLSLHYVADLSISEVAAHLGIPVGTAKSRLNTALRKLRTGIGAT